MAVRDLSRAATRDTTRRGPRRLLSAGALSLVVLLTGSGCDWKGLNSIALPGAEGNGDGAYEITVEMPNVTTLTMNSPVRVNDVNVGRITRLEARDYTAIVGVSLNEEVQLPHNAYAKIGQTSLLGSQHLELFPPAEEKPVGRLQGGDTIPLAHAGVYPTTEQTLSALSVVLTDGGLQQFQTISDELNKALDGRQLEAKDVIGQLRTTVGGLDKQRGDIVAAMDGLDRLSRQINQQNDTLSKAFAQLPDALKLVNDQKQQLTSALVTLGDFGNKANQIIAAGGGRDLAANLQDLVPVLTALADSGRDLTRVLNILITFPFPQSALNNFLKGDFANLYVDADFTNSRMSETFLLGTDLGNRMSGLEGYFGMAPDAHANADPFTLSVQQKPGGAPAPGAPAPGAPAPAPAPAPAQGGAR